MAGECREVLVAVNHGNQANDLPVFERDWKEINYHVRILRQRFRLDGADCDDARQELARDLVLASRRFDPTLASWRTFCAGVLDIERRLVARKIRSHRLRDARVAHALRAGLAREVSDPDPVRAEQQLAVRRAVARLPERQRAVCSGLLGGGTISAVARQLGVHRATVHRDIGLIRRRFEHLGLRGSG